MLTVFFLMMKLFFLEAKQLTAFYSSQLLMPVTFDTSSIT